MMTNLIDSTNNTDSLDALMQLLKHLVNIVISNIDQDSKKDQILNKPTIQPTQKPYKK